LKHLRITLFGLIFSLGLIACQPTKRPPLDLAGHPLPTYNPPPTETPLPLTATAEISPTPTQTQIPPTITSTPITCWNESGRIELHHLNTIWLTEPLEYRVYLPPCYDFESFRLYPVLYLIHGYGYQGDQWINLGASRLMDQLSATGEMDPFLIVMPYDGDHNALPPENQFGEALRTDLVRVIDENYRTLPSPQYRAIGGLSRGGNWAIHIGLTNWTVFGQIGAHSAPLFVTDGPSKIESWLKEIPLDAAPTVYLDIGESDKWVEHIFRFEELIDKYDIPHEIHLYPGSHMEEYWAAHTEDYLRWYAQNWE
jgi:enterochelin esterase-like enzyme